MTNFDKLKAEIAAMSVEEFLNLINDEVYKRFCTMSSCIETSCDRCFKRWLNEESVEN